MLKDYVSHLPFPLIEPFFLWIVLHLFFIMNVDHSHGVFFVFYELQIEKYILATRRSTIQKKMTRPEKNPTWNLSILLAPLGVVVLGADELSGVAEALAPVCQVKW